MPNKIINNLKEALRAVHTEGTELDKEEARYLLKKYQELLAVQGGVPAITFIPVRNQE